MLTLHWQALQPVIADYKVFFHLANPSERIWGQDDGQPTGGTYPTMACLPGQIVIVGDRHTVETDPAPPTGFFRLMAGMYARSTAQRLLATDDSAAVTEDRILLSTLEITSSAEE